MSNCSSCKRTPTMNSDNSSVCPFRMSDGRNFTDYTPNCMSYTGSNRKFKSSYDERQYYIHNANELMNKNEKYAIDQNGNCCSYNMNESGTMLPEKNMISCNGKTCTSEMVNENGLGDGRKY